MKKSFDIKQSWKLRNNCILLDMTTGEFKTRSRTHGKMRLYLGRFVGDQFEVTVESIRYVSPELDMFIRKVVKYIMLKYVKDIDASMNKQTA